MRPFTICLLIFLLTVVACASPPSPATDTTTLVGLNQIPPVDRQKHIVPLEEIYFDTFRSYNRAVPLTKADDKLVDSLLDAIPPLYTPQFESAETADRWLYDDALVIGYTDGDEAFAYPALILNWHEIVIQTVNNRPILVSYCPLCRSGVVYDRTLNGQELVFGNTSALYESNMVMVDHQTGSYWVQISGQALVGELAGAQLKPLASQTTTWRQWLTLYPNTLVLSQDTGYNRDYRTDVFSGFGRQLNASGQFLFPVSETGRDDRLQPADVVLGVELNGKQIAYPIAAIGDGVVNDTFEGTPLVVFSAQEGETGVAYDRRVKTQTLSFVFEGGQYKDQETGSIWLLNGRAIAGDLMGTQLTPLPVRSSFWYSLIATFPDLVLYLP